METLLVGVSKNDLNFYKLLECPICCDYLEEVRETPCCHLLFCANCITSWSKSNQNCPGCRSKLELQKCTKNVPIQRFVDNLPMSCPNKMHGCPVSPPRSELEKHKKLCEYQPEILADLKKKKEALLIQLKTEISKVKADLAKPNLKPAQKAEKNVLLLKVLLQIAEIYQSIGEWKEAISVWTDVNTISTQNKDKFNALLQLGVCFSNDSQFDKAMTSFESALKISKENKRELETVEILLQIGETLFKMGKFAEALTKYEEAALMARDPASPGHPLLGKLFLSIGLVHKKASDYEAASKTFQEAVKLIPEAHPQWPDLILLQADLLRKRGDFNDSRDLYIKVLRKLESQHGSNHPQIASVCNDLGMLTKKEGKYHESSEYYKTALKIGKHFYGKDHPSIGMYLTNLGDIYRKQGDFKKAQGTYMEALHTLEKTLGPNHVEVAEVLNSMGLVLKKQADYDGAEKLYERAIGIIKKTFGEKHYKLGIYSNNLGDIARKRGKLEDAEKLYLYSLKAIEETLGKNHAETADILHNLGQIKHQQEKYKEAVDFYKTALQVVKTSFNDKHYKYGMFLDSLGLAHAMLEDFTSAYDEMKQAVQILLACLGQDHVELADVYANLGDVCMKLVAEGKAKKQNNLLEEAKKYYTQANKIIAASLGPDHAKCKNFASLLFICENYSSFT